VAPAWYHRGMRLRFGLVVGFAAGYYLGTKAGRERYEQLRRIVDLAEPGAKVRAAVDFGRDRIGAAVGAHMIDPVPPPSSN